MSAKDIFIKSTFLDPKSQKLYPIWVTQETQIQIQSGNYCYEA